MKAVVFAVLYFLSLIFGALLLAYMAMHGHSEDAGGGLCVYAVFLIVGGVIVANEL